MLGWYRSSLKLGSRNAFEWLHQPPIRRFGEACLLCMRPAAIRPSEGLRSMSGLLYLFMDPWSRVDENGRGNSRAMCRHSSNMYRNAPCYGSIMDQTFYNLAISGLTDFYSMKSACQHPLFCRHSSSIIIVVDRVLVCLDNFSSLFCSHGASYTHLDGSITASATSRSLQRSISWKPHSIGRGSRQESPGNCLSTSSP